MDGTLYHISSSSKCSLFLPNGENQGGQKHSVGYCLIQNVEVEVLLPGMNPPKNPSNAYGSPALLWLRKSLAYFSNAANQRSECN